MQELEANVRAIEKDGLVWGASKLVAVGFGIKKLQINIVIEDEKVSLDELQQQIEEDEDHVQSTDVVSLSFIASAFAKAMALSEWITLTCLCVTGCYAEVVDGWRQCVGVLDCASYEERRFTRRGIYTTCEMPSSTTKSSIMSSSVSTIRDRAFIYCSLGQHIYPNDQGCIVIRNIFQD